MGSLTWKLNRLRSMSVPELVWRIGQTTRSGLEGIGWGLAADPPPPQLPHSQSQSQSQRRWLIAPACADRSAIARAADELLAGRWSVFGADALLLGLPPQWNRDPQTGTVAPLARGKAIDYRDPRKVGNIKTLWEPSRHLQLVTLAQAQALSGERRYAEGCRTLIESWIEQCPYPLGVHWSSSLELAIRLLNWAVAWELLGGCDAPVFVGGEGRRFRDTWVASVYRHCHFIEGHLSRHSSANNHLLGEWMGLFIASLTWPCWPDSARWRARSQAGFEAEALKQNAPDGVNREQALYYHHEVADMMLLCGLVGRAHGTPFSAAYWQRLEAMLDFVLAAMDAGGHVPMIGDADDALMVRLHHEPDWDPYRSLLASGAVLFKRGDFKAASRGFDGKSRWLLGESAAREYNDLPAAPPVPKRRVFEQGGYTVLGSRFGTGNELKIVADAAPLGYLSIAAHGHADALAFTLSARGHELLIDPGTYAYHTEREWRDWFRGTAAHNTVTVDGENQSVIGGSFMWLRQARATLEEVSLGSERDVWQASHDGYRRLRDPLTHRRRVVVEHARGIVLVDDTLQCAGTHVAAIHWHVAESARVRIDGLQVLIEVPGVRLRMAMPGSTNPPVLLRGSTDPRGGWVSRRFGVKIPATQVAWSFAFAGTTQWRTEMQLETTT